MSQIALVLERFDAFDEEPSTSPLAADAEQTALVQRARAEAYAAGFAAGQVASDNIAAAEERHNEHLVRLIGGCECIMERLNESAHDFTPMLSDVIQLLLQRLFPRLTELGFAEEISAIAAKYVQRPNPPRLELRTSPCALTKVSAALERRGLASQVEVRPQTGLADAEAEIIWAKGGVSINFDAMIAEADAALQRILGSQKKNEDKK